MAAESVARRRSRLLLLVASVAILAGCNMLTGADALVIGSGDGGNGGASEGAGPPGGGGGDGAGDLGGGSSSSGQGGSPPVEQMVAAPGVTLTGVIAYQGVSRPIMTGGAAASSTTPLVADRRALFRLLYELDGGYDGAPVTARLSFAGAPPVEQVVTLGHGAAEANLQSTVNFDVPAALMSVGASYRVDVLQPAAGGTADNPAARYPLAAEAFEPLPTQQAGPLTVTLVPVQYNADGSGRLPDTSPGQLQAYGDLFYGIYPVSDVDIQVRAQPMAWNSGVYNNGSGWSALLNAVADLRVSDGAPPTNYYYGIFEPAGSMGSYCGAGCVAGLGFIGGPTDNWSHAAIGMGFSGAMSTETAVHEIGHNHGREHAPCGTSGDSSYPYPGASIGAWGYDLVTGSLFSPSQYVDMMSYCNPTWISDYNFTAIFNRVKFVNGASIYTPPALMNRSYERLLVGPNGKLSFMAPLVLERPPGGEATTVTVGTTSGPEQLTGQLVRYDHLPGGVLFIPPTAHALSVPKMATALIDGALLTTGP